MGKNIKIKRKIMEECNPPLPPYLCICIACQEKKTLERLEYLHLRFTTPTTVFKGFTGDIEQVGRPVADGEIISWGEKYEIVYNWESEWAWLEYNLALELLKELRGESQESIEKRLFSTK